MVARFLLCCALCLVASQCIRLKRVRKFDHSGLDLKRKDNKTQIQLQLQDKTHEWMKRQENREKFIRITKRDSINIYIGIVGCMAVLVLALIAFRHTYDSQTSTVTLTMLRMSGKRIATLCARSTWCSEELEQELSAHLAPNEHVHSILYETGTCRQRMPCSVTIGQIGFQDGAELGVIVLPWSALPSGVSLFSHASEQVCGTGRRKVARLWLHEDKSLSLEYGKIFDVDKDQMNYLRGVLDDKESVVLQNDALTIVGSICVSDGPSRITSLVLPGLGGIELKQEFPDAVFDVCQSSGFSGWISLFKCSELVVKLAKKSSEDTQQHVANLRLQLCSKPLPDGSIKFFCAKKQEFSSWGEESRLQDYDISWTATLEGRVGCRKLVLVGFPFLGNLELVENPFCSEMTEKWERAMSF